MQDTISKNTGNSRYLASVPNFLTLYPTYEAFAQALINRELPIDLGPLNPAGCQQIGDNLNKANLLKDSTAALYGKPATATPDDILVKINELFKTQLVVLTGSYTGSGRSGYSRTISCYGYRPYLFILYIDSSSSSDVYVSLQYAATDNEARGIKYISVGNYGIENYNAVLRLRDGDILLAETTGSNLDISGRTYFWAAICKKI